MGQNRWRRPEGCGLGRGLLDRVDDIIAARESERSESLLRLGYRDSDVIAPTLAQAHESCSATGTE